MKKVLLILFTMFVGVVAVFASEFTLEQVADKMKTTSIYELFNDEEDPVVINTTDNSMIVTNQSGTTKPIKFDYADGIISYEFNGDKNNEADVEESILDILWIGNVIYGVGLLHGYTEDQIEIWLEENLDSDTLTLEEDGIEITTFDYEFSGTTDNGTYRTSGSTVDTFKIDINRFNIDVDELPNNGVKPVPKVKVSSVGTNSITFDVSADVSELSEDDSFCYLYRSNDAVDFEEIVDFGDCNGQFVDENLEPGTTYYYMAMIGFFGESSDIVSVTTKAATDGNNNNNNNNTNNTNNNGVNNNIDNSGNITQNPQTGVNIVIFAIVISMLLSIIYLVYFARKYVDELN